MATRKKTSPKKRPTDVNELAHFLGQQSTNGTPEAEPTQADINRVMRVLGSRGGKIGGKRRLVTLTQERRSEIAYKAAQARWGKKTKKP